MFTINLVKKLLFFIPGLGGYLSLVAPAFAQKGIDPCTGAAGLTGIAKAVCDLAGKDFGLVVQNVAIIIIVLAVIIALLYLLYGGIKWIMSRGDKTEVEAARNHITAAIIGLIVVFLAVFIVVIVLGLFGVQLTNLVIPKI